MRAALAVVLALVAACDSGPKGPGTLAGSIEGPLPLGAAVIEVRGEGVTGFEGAANTHVFSTSPGLGVHHVVLIGEEAGELAFRVRVSEVRDAPPVAAVLSASDGNNLPVTSVQAFRVLVTR